jgi:hypothetical protein
MQVCEVDTGHLCERYHYPKAEEQVAGPLGGEPSRKLQAAAPGQTGKSAVLFQDEVGYRAVECREHQPHHESRQFEQHTSKLTFLSQRLNPVNLLGLRVLNFLYSRHAS